MAKAPSDVKLPWRALPFNAQQRADDRLAAEGPVYEVVCRVRELFKQAKFEIADRMHLYVVATSDLMSAINDYSEYIKGEALAVKLSEAEPPEVAVITEAWFGRQWVRVGIVK